MGMLLEYLRKQQAEQRKSEAEMGLGQKRMYATERDSYLQLHLCKSLTKNLQNDFKDRYELAKCTEEMAIATENIAKAMTKIYYTIPESQRPLIDHNADNVAFAVGVKTPGSVGIREGDSQWGLYLSYADIYTMVTALKDHCLTCLGSPQEQECCELRKVFDRMGVDAEHMNGECAYRELI